MKLFKHIFLFIALLFCGNIHAQTSAEARQLLDKATAIINNRNGVVASFSLSRPGMPGRTSGTVYIKGTKFMATTPQMTVWFNGKTQWSYMKKTNEVNITNPSPAQQTSLNPLSLVNMYKTGYALSLKKSGANKVVHLTGGNKKRGISEMYITVSPANMVKIIKLKNSGKWTTVTVNSLKTSSLADGMFVFNKSKYPKAEVVDLR